MDMHDPAPAGEVLAGWLADLKMTVTALAAHLGISRVMLSRILHGHAAVTAASTCACMKPWAPRPASGCACRHSATCGWRASVPRNGHQWQESPPDGVCDYCGTCVTYTLHSHV